MKVSQSIAPKAWPTVQLLKQIFILKNFTLGNTKGKRQLKVVIATKRPKSHRGHESHNTYRREYIAVYSYIHTERCV